MMVFWWISSPITLSSCMMHTSTNSLLPSFLSFACPPELQHSRELSAHQWRNDLEKWYVSLFSMTPV
jgi:hypothetical protein